MDVGPGNRVKILFNGDGKVDRTTKKEWVGSLHNTLSEVASVVVVRNSGLTVAEISDLRGKMRKAGAGFKVVKNRLTRLALTGTEYEKIADLFTGPTAIAFSKDPVAAAKIAVEFAKTNDKLVLKAGSYAGKVLDKAGVQALASIPSREELLSKLLYVMQAPVSGFVRGLAALAEQKQAEAA